MQAPAWRQRAAGVAVFAPVRSPEATGLPLERSTGYFALSAVICRAEKGRAASSGSVFRSAVCRFGPASAPS